MHAHSSQLTKIGCPFSKADLSGAMPTFIQELGAQKCSLDAWGQATEAASSHESLPPHFTRLPLETRKQMFGKALLYQIGGELQEEAVKWIRVLRENFPETHGISEIQELTLLRGQNASAEVKARAPKARLDSLPDNPHELISVIATTQLEMCTNVVHAVCQSFKQDSRSVYLLCNEIIKSLPDRNADTLERFLTSGYEAACLMPLELFRISLYKCIESFGSEGGAQYGRDFNRVDLATIETNSKPMLFHLATMTFTDFNDLRREFCYPHSVGERWSLDYQQFALCGRPGDRKLHLDFKNAPDISEKIRVAELKIGCLGKVWIPEFFDWASELHQAYFVPRIEQMIPQIQKEISAI
jgi:hypothetical protein